MIKHTIVISQGPAYLSVEHGQLLIRRKDQPDARVPVEDIGVLLIDQPAVTYTHGLLVRLCEAGAAVVLCGERHLPTGLLLPFENNELTGRRLRAQAAAPIPLRKRLWKQVVRRKVRLQALNLPEGHKVRRRLLRMVREVRSGDAGNVEGQAARFYWPALLGPDFRRDPDSDSPPNGLLNYGYTVMRSMVARAIVASGLHPALGLQHRHRGNAFALADDLMETLRPMVDAAVADLFAAGTVDVTAEAKRILLELMTREIRVTGDRRPPADGAQPADRGPLMVQFQRVCTSLVRAYESAARSPDTGEAGPDQPRTPRRPPRLALPMYTSNPAHCEDGKADDDAD